MKRSRLALSICLIVLVTVSVLSTRSQQAYQRAPEVWPVNNQTQALRIASLTDRGGVGTKHTFEISVVNVSDKAIVEYTFFKKDGSALTTSGATTGWSLAPGESDAVKADLGPGETITLAALLFADGTGQGDAGELTRMKDYRVGVEEQYRRAVPILNQVKGVAAAAEANSVAAALRQQLASLPVPPVGEGVSAGKSAGMHDAKQFIEVQVTQPQGKADEKTVSLETLHSRVNQALGHVEKALTRFHGDLTTR